MAEKPTQPTPDKPETQAETKKPANSVEKTSVQKGRQFHESRDKLKNLREKAKNGKKTAGEQDKAKKDLDLARGGFDMGPGKTPEKQENFVESPEVKDKKAIEQAEQETMKALKEKHETEMQEELEKVDWSSLDEETRKSIHADTLASSVDVSKMSESEKRKILGNPTNSDWKPVDVSNLSQDQIDVIQRKQAKKYIESLAQLSDEVKNNPEKFNTYIAELEKKNPGVTDFVSKNKIELLTEKDFFETAKKDPSILSETIESIKTDGLVATGIDPESALGKKLSSISQGNISEYIKTFPDEADITKMQDILGGSYVDIIAGAPFAWLDNFQPSINSVRTALKESWFREGILREDFKTDKEFQDALERQAKSSTGMGVQQIERIAKKVSRSKLSPFVKFLADLLAPFGAMMPWETGAFWREYLAKSSENKPDTSMNSWGGGNFEQLAEVNSSELINAARKYLGRPYKMWGLGRKDVPWDPIDCSQLVVNSLIDTGCLPPGSDTTAMGFASMSQKIGDTEGKEGDFLIMSQPSPHIALITANLWGGKYKTIESASGKGGVVETERNAGQSFSVYRNPFLEGNGGIKRRGMPSDLASMKDIMKWTSTKPEYVGWIEGAADVIKKNQARYERVSQATGVPWELIGAIHYRESDFDFGAALHNGDKIIGTGRKTYRVPAGRWPFNTWEESAIDALRMKGGLGFTSMNGSDDQLRRVAAYAERYNGYGYRNRGGVSPYVWGGTPLYKWGRFVADHVYDPNSYDKRPGVMPIILSVLKKWGVQPPTEMAQKDAETKTWTAADWFRNNDGKLYGGGEWKYDCMTSTHAALGLDYSSRYGGAFNGKYIDQKDSKHNLWNVAMAWALYSGAISGANSQAEDGIIKKQGNWFYGTQYDDPTNMEYHIEENIMKRTEGWKRIDVPAKWILVHYGSGYDRWEIMKEIDLKLKEWESAMMGGTGEGTNKWGHEWLVTKEKWQLVVHESTKTGGGDWRGVVNGVNGQWYSLSEYLLWRKNQHSGEAIIFSKK